MSLEKRIIQLERNGQAWKLLAGALALLLLGTLACSTRQAEGDNQRAGHPVAGTNDGTVVDVIKAREFQLVNVNGAVVGSFFASPGGGGLELHASGSPRHVVVNPYGIGLKDDDLGDLNLNTSGIVMTELTSEGREARRANQGKHGQEAEEKFVVSILRGKEGGGGVIDVYNPLGKRAVSVQANKQNNGFVYTYDFAGNPIK